MFWGTCDKFLIQNPANTIVEIDQYYILKGMDRDHPFKGNSFGVEKMTVRLLGGNFPT